VTVAVPKLAEGYGCMVGRTGVEQEASNLSRIMRVAGATPEAAA
jgi:hypothetical protein